MQRLLTYMLLISSLILAGGASIAGTEYPATFQSGRFIISTLDQFEKRNAELHPELEIVKTPIDSIEYKDQTYNGFKISAEGVEKGNKIIQLITYVELFPGLWKLIYVENKVCIRSSILEDGEMVQKWFCDEDPFPITGFHDLFLVTDKNVDIEAIQPAFEEPIERYQADVEVAAEDRIMSLADLQKALAQVGSTMVHQGAEYRPALQPDAKPQPAVEIYIEGVIEGDKTVKQTFTYVVEGDLLKLKEIDGVICWYVDSLEKEICDPVYVPTPASSVPMQLLNHEQLTGTVIGVDVAATPQEVPKSRQCGALQDHFATILKVHFERSLFDASKPEEFDRFINNFPDTADPMGLLLSQQDKQRLLADFKSQPQYEDRRADLIEQFKAGRLGDCGWLVQFMEQLKGELLQKSSQVFQLLSSIQVNDYQVEGLPQSNLSPAQVRVLEKIPQVVPVALQTIQPKAAIDVALGRMKIYIERTLARMSDLEQFTVSAMAQQDDYSTMIAVAGDIAGTLNGHQEKKYFGLSVEIGFSQNHYIVRLHPAAQAQGLQLGDKVLRINGQEAQQMSTEEVDSVLLDTDHSIQLSIRQGGLEKAVNLQSTRLNPLRFYYQVSVQSINDRVVLNIQMSSFEPGITKAIYDDVIKILQTQTVDAFVLDLRNNPGGNTDEAINVLSLFAKDRVVAFSKLGARHFSALKEYPAKAEFFIDDSKPLVVKVNHRTMSSSEIVASNYQALGRSLTVGGSTYGKLVGQFYIPISLQDQRQFGLLLTAFEFFNVKGQALNGIGVTPDYITEEVMTTPSDGGVGLGRDISSDQLPEVQLYDFSAEDVVSLGLNLAD